MRRKRERPGGTTSRDGGPAGLHRPFSELARTLRTRAVAPPRRSSEGGAASSRDRLDHAPARPADDSALFARAMDGVVPLAPRERERVVGPAPARAPRPPVSEAAEALAALSELVTGEVRFDVTDTREYVEGVVAGLDPRLVRRLRRGDFAWQQHLDLHGLTTAEARPAVQRFLVEAVRAGHRCVLVVHGRGHNSKDRTPVLKERLVAWLAHGALARMVLAFATARPHDGGAGALYVLLRRDRRRREIRVATGSGA